MIDFRTLGRVDVRDPSRAEAREILSQPKRLALLAYIALNPGVRRDALVAVFWPELDQEHARGALRQALRQLRRTLGDDAGAQLAEEHLEIPPDLLRCDAVEFSRACADGRAADALPLYGGDFLDGLHVEASPAFEDWLAATRARLRQCAAKAEWAAHDRALGAGDPAAALAHARRAVQLEPFDEGALRRLLKLLDQLGDRAGAIAEYERFTERLQRELEVAPSAETQGVVSAIRTRVAARSVEALAGEGLPPMPPPAASKDDASRRPMRPHALGFAAVALIATAALLFVGRAPAARPAHRSLEKLRVLIAPFRVTASDSTAAYLRDGMVDLLAARLGGRGGPVPADTRASLLAWQREAASAPGDRSDALAIRAARTVDAGAAIVGEIVASGTGVLDLHARLLSVPDGAVLARAELSGPGDSIFSLTDRLAAALLLNGARTPGDRPDAPRPPLPAVRAFLEGESALRADRAWDAEGDFARALDLDSTYVPFVVGAALASYGTGNTTRPFRLLHAALDRLNDRDRALAAALIGPNYPTLPSERATLDAWERAANVAPDDPDAWANLGERLARWGSLLGVPHWRERALAAFEHAQRLDPGAGHVLEDQLILAARWGDLPTVRDAEAALLRMEPPPENVEFLEWAAAAATADVPRLDSIRGRFDGMHVVTLLEILAMGQRAPFGIEDARRAADLVDRRSGDREERGRRALRLHDFALNEGRRADALRELQRLRALEHDRASGGASDFGFDLSPGAAQRVAVTDALYWDGSEQAAIVAVQAIGARAAGYDPALARRRPGVAFDVCVLAQWEASRGDHAAARRLAAALGRAAAPGDSTLAAYYDRKCSALVEALLALAGSPEAMASAADALERIESMGFAPFRDFAQDQLVLARLRERAGDRAAARAAIHRYLDGNGIEYVSSYLAADTALAARLGATAGADSSARRLQRLRARAAPDVPAPAAALADLGPSRVPAPDHE